MFSCMLIPHFHHFRGFGFVVFNEPEVLDTLLERKHSLDGREVSTSNYWLCCVIMSLVLFYLL